MTQSPFGKSLNLSKPHSVTKLFKLAFRKDRPRHSVSPSRGLGFGCHLENAVGATDLLAAATDVTIRKGDVRRARQRRHEKARGSN
jgi:hypothetical protein